jgi:hypothetical protein
MVYPRYYHLFLGGVSAKVELIAVYRRIEMIYVYFISNVSSVIIDTQVCKIFLLEYDALKDSMSL